MGASISLPQTATLPAATTRNAPNADPFFAELGGEIVYDKSMGSARFLKTIRGRHRQGAVVVKLFTKLDQTLELKQFQRRLKTEREALRDCVNVLPYARAIETERAGYLIRQWVASNLYDRISTRPFLSSIEKRWITFQLLTGLKDARERGIAHGDIKTENIVVTSWNWIFLTDFSSSFKPTYLPLDDPSVFSFYFDTSSRRSCYLAPERFYASNSPLAKQKASLEFGKRDGKVTEEMDVFSAGCVIAELWMEGTSPFTLTQLFKYREGQYDLEAYLNEIEHVEIRSLIRSMISLEPSSRLSFSTLLSQYRQTAFPDIFYTFLHPFLNSLNRVSAPLPPSAPTASSSFSQAQSSTTRLGTATPTPGLAEPQQQTLLRTDADERIERVWNEWEIIQRYLDESLEPDDRARIQKDSRGERDASEYGRKDKGKAKAEEEEEEEDVFPIKLNLPGMEGKVVTAGCTKDGPALILLALISSNVRNCQHPSSILRAIELLLALNRYLTDETRLDRLVPYLVTLLSDEESVVRSMALRALTQTLMLVQTLTPSNLDLFPSYILPNTLPFSTDPETLPRVTYALCCSRIAEVAKKFLNMAEAMKGDGGIEFGFSGGTGGNGGEGEFEGNPYAANYDTRLSELHAQISLHLGPLLTDPAPSVRRALLYSIPSLCQFFGRAKANDQLLAHLVTYLNTRDWLLRYKWNEVCVGVAGVVGAKALEEYVLPLIVLSLADPEEFVTVKVLETLTILASRRLLAKSKTWELVQSTSGFLCHPNIWIREGTATFLATVSTLLQPTDRWCIFYPIVKRLLRADVKDITALSLLDNAREPLPRMIFEAAVSWAGKAGKSNFWSLARTNVKGAPRDAGVRTDEDHAQLEKMRLLGMKPEDEYKLSAMRDYINKLAAARQAAPSRSTDPSADALLSTANSSLQDLGVVPQTIFFTVKPQSEALNAARTRLTTQSPSDFSGGGLLGRRASSTATGGGELPRSPHSPSGDRPITGRSVSGGQLTEDLRRRLALGGVGGSNASLSSLQHETSPAARTTGMGTSLEPPINLNSGDLHLKRTVSQTDTEISDVTASTSTSTFSNPTTSPASRPPARSRVRLSGVEVAKVSPAIAEDSTNAMGLFDVDARYREGSEAEAGGSVAGTELNSAAGFGRSTGKRIIAPQRFVSTYEGNDPSIKQLLERTYLDSYSEALPELGPRVGQSIPRRRALRTSFPPRERTPTRPEGTLIAHLVEHTAAITDIAVAPDQLFFATGSEDGTVKIWDTMRLEKNVTSKSRQTFQQGGKITSVILLESSHCVASASTNGTVWIHRVDVGLSGTMPKYSKPALIRQYKVDEKDDFVTCLASYNTQTTNNLVFGTSLSTISILDVRTMRSLHTFKNPRHLGPITSICIDRKHLWLVAGTASGTLTLWDLRFGLLLRSWSIGARRIEKIALHPSKGKGRWIVVAAEGEELEGKNSRTQGTVVAEVWNLEEGTKVEDFRIITPQQAATSSAVLTNRTNLFSPNDELPSPAMHETTLDPAAAIEALLASSTAPPSKNPIRQNETSPSQILPSIRSFLVGIDYSLQPTARPSVGNPDSIESREGKKDGGFLLTGGEDRKLRFWDLGRATKSAVISGLDIDEETPTFSVHASTTRPNLYLEAPPPVTNSSSNNSSTSSRSRPAASTSRVHRSTLIANSQQQLMKAHREAITALAIVDLPFRCVVSGDRSGVVKVFE
ncbi:ubiquitin-binding serine/threonine protein kinase VPS15 [Sporobolomyces salmoneus]|uniref:ubiquitin-binding serine/threonine protein kinase VPS15 n=1 Tax=Sporobolomyces salmoneus TaxID=183962 RepID=UPI00317F1683